MLVLTQWSSYWPLKCKLVDFYYKYIKSYYELYIIKIKNKNMS